MDVVFFFKLEMPLLLYCLTHALYKWEMLIFFDDRLYTQAVPVM